MERLPINSCSYRDLMSLPQVGPRIAETLLSIRKQYGNVTEDDIRSVQYIRNPEQLIELIDFTEYVAPFQSTPRRPLPSYDAPPAPRRSLGLGRRQGAPTYYEEEDLREDFLDWDPFRHDYTPEAHDRAVYQGKVKRENQNRSQRNDRNISNISKCITYNGLSKWKPFFSKFTAYTDEQNLSGSQRKTQLCFCLQGKACDYYSMLTDKVPKMEFFDIVRKLEQRFGQQELPEASQIQFQYIKQKQDEEVVDWSDRVLCLAQSAFQDLNEEQVDKHATIKFCQGLYDKDAGQYAINQKPKTVEEALELVKWFQHTHKVMYGRSFPKRDIRYTSGAEEEFDVRKLGTSPSHTDQKPNKVRFQEPDQETEKRLQKLEQMAQSNRSKMESMESKLDKILAALSRSNSPAPRGRSPSPMRKPVCYKCGDPNHFKRDCPELTKQVNAVDTAEDNLNFEGLAAMGTTHQSESE